jgi:type IX secretion system PorP/SprF family membrane protein
MKKLFTVLSLTVMAYYGFAQQDYQGSQFTHSKLSYNPGYAGTNGAICAAAIYRQQWVGFPGAPKTGILTIDAPVLRNTAYHGGAGLTVISDQLGNDKSIFARAGYAYHRLIGVGILSIGLDLGILQKSFSNNWITSNPNDVDPKVPTAVAGGVSFDLGLGIYYSTPKLYAGLSSSHLPSSSIKDQGKNFDFKSARHYYLVAGYHIPVSSDFKLTPNILVKTDGVVTIPDANLTLLYNETVWVGVSYRHQDAAVAMIGFQKNTAKNAWKIGYSYDITLSNLKSQNKGTHEIMLGYCIKLPNKMKIQSHINPRFLK